VVHHRDAVPHPNDCRDAILVHRQDGTVCRRDATEWRVLDEIPAAAERHSALAGVCRGRTHG